MRIKRLIFGERSLTKVAGVFSSKRLAASLADTQRQIDVTMRELRARSVRVVRSL